MDFGQVKTPCGDCVDGRCTMNCSPVEMAHFECLPQEYVGVTTPTLIYIGIKDRAEFDKIALPLHDAGENERGHVLVKRLGECDGTSVTIIFQHWLKSLTTAGYTALRERNAAKSAVAQ